MTTIATLAVKLIADAAEFIQGMDSAERSTQNWATRVGTNLKQVGGQMTATGTRVTAGVTLPLVAAGVAAINMASDLDETKNKVSVVFGDMSADVLGWSQTSATAMGQSQNQALAATATYGNLFITMGLGQKPAADMSMSLVGLAADLASFNNADPSEVLAAIQSGLVGQVEPLRKYGVVLSEAAVQAKAMELGLVDADGELTEAAKLQARYAIIMAQTTTAQGDFARTADGMANQTRIMKAQVADAAAALGVQLLPYALQLIQAISQLVTWFSNLSPGMQKTILIILAIVAVIGPLLMMVGGLVTAIGAIAGVIGAISGPVLIVIAVIAALIALVGALYLAWTQNWLGIRDKFAAFVAWIKPIWQKVWGWIKYYLDYVLAQIRTLYEAFRAALEGDWYTFGEKLREFWDRAWNFIMTIASSAWNWILSSIRNFIVGVINYFQNMDWQQLGRNMIMGIINGVNALREWAIQQMLNFAMAIYQTFMGFFGIHSPSSLMEEMVGKNLAMGITVGFEKNLDMNKLMASTNVNTAAGMTGGGGRGGDINIYLDGQRVVNVHKLIRESHEAILDEIGLALTTAGA